VAERAKRVVDFPSLGFLVADWIEQHCIVPDGFYRGEPFTLYDWQLWCTLNHYRLRTSATLGQLNRAFHYRRSQVVAPQKTGKGPWSATIICAEAVGPVLFDGWSGDSDAYECDAWGCGCGWVYEYVEGEPRGRPWPTPLIQLVATAADQVDNVYRPLQSIVRGSVLGEQMRVGEEFIRLPNDGRIDVVTSSAQARLGNPITFGLLDESGVYTKQNGMISVADTMRRGLAGMSGRAMETTNAWDPTVDSTARRTAEYEPDEGDERDIFRFHELPPASLDYQKKADRRKIHEYVYDGSEHVDLDSIEAEAAELLAFDPGQAERFFGNRPSAGVGKAFDAEKWADLATPGFVVPSQSLVVVGVDGARFHDALAIIATDVVFGHQWVVKIIEAPDPAPDGYEHDLEDADRAMLDLFETHHVWRAYVDPQYIETLFERWQGRWGAERIIGWLTYRQRPVGYAMRRYREAQSVSDLTHDGNERFAAHIGNAVRSPMNVKDDVGRAMWTLAKPEPRLKIDAAMAGALSWEARGDAIAAGVKKPSNGAWFI
jgi:hypothetical protein